MPFRHLLFNRRNGAPQSAPRSQPISLESVRYFNLESEFPNQIWPEDTSQQLFLHNQGTGTEELDITKQQQIAHINLDPIDTSIGCGSLYQSTPSKLEALSLCHADLIDTDTSSISQGSIHSSLSSTSHLDMRFDRDYSAHSLSRKSSLASNYASDIEQDGLCPLLTGQIGKCNPSRCGPNSPCLQYIHGPIEEYIQQTVEHLHIPGNNGTVPTEFTLHSHSPPTESHSLGINLALAREHVLGSTPLLSSVDSDTKISEMSQASEKISTLKTTDRHTKRARARQSHSLVEKKYRENLNSKIYELHNLLQRTESHRSQSRNPSNASVDSTPQHLMEQGEDDYTEDKSFLKVKKSDVLVEAITYVRTSEAQMAQMQEQIQQLRERIHLMEDWISRNDRR